MWLAETAGAATFADGPLALHVGGVGQLAAGDAGEDGSSVSLPPGVGDHAGGVLHGDRHLGEGVGEHAVRDERDTSGETFAGSHEDTAAALGANGIGGAELARGVEVVEYRLLESGSVDHDAIPVQAPALEADFAAEAVFDAVWRATTEVVPDQHRHIEGGEVPGPTPRRVAADPDLLAAELRELGDRVPDLPLQRRHPGPGLDRHGDLGEFCLEHVVADARDSLGKLLAGSHELAILATTHESALWLRAETPVWVEGVLHPLDELVDFHHEPALVQATSADRDRDVETVVVRVFPLTLGAEDVGCHVESRQAEDLQWVARSDFAWHRAPLRRTMVD